MSRRYTAVTLSIGLVAAWTVVAQEVRRDGRWEVTMEMSMPAMPNMPNMRGMNMPATTITQCVTKEDAADPQKTMAPQGRGNQSTDCKVTDFKQVGNKVTYNIACTQPQPMTAKADFTYGPDKYDGTMTMEMARGGQPMQMTTKYSAKRLGDCTTK